MTKSHNFSDSFNSVMYEDNTLFTASKHYQRLTVGHHEWVQKKENKVAELQSLINRRKMATQYKNKFGICIKSEEVKRLSEIQLFIKLET